MASRVKTRRKVIQTPCLPGIRGEWTGETITYGREQKMVYREPLPHHLRSKVVPKTGPDGNTLWKFHGGQPVRVQTERVDTISPDDGAYWREYIVVDLGNGKADKVFNFREDPARLKAKADAEARERAKDALLDSILDSGLDPSQVIEAVRGVKAASNGSAAEPVKVHRGSGKWNVMRGDEVLAEKVTAEEADRVLADAGAHGNEAQQ